MNDNEGNGKVERLIRTINERLRTNKSIKLEKDHSGLSELLYALRGAKRPNKPCPAELHNNRQFTTVKDIITTKPNKNYTVLDNDNYFQLEMSDFPGEQDSEILVRERARRTKLDDLYKKEKGTIPNETDHTITISNKKRHPATYSKRDVAMPNEPQASSRKQITRKLQYNQSPVSSPELTKNAKPNKMAKPIKTTGPKKRSKLPKEFQRLTNWEQLANDSTDEEEESRRQKAAVKAEKAADKATVVREKPTKTEPDSDEEETTSQ